MTFSFLRDLPLKNLLPFLFLASGFVLILLFSLLILPRTQENAFTFAKQQSQTLAQTEQGRIISLLSADVASQIERVIFFTSSNPQVKKMVIADENNIIRFAHRTRLIGTRLADLDTPVALDIVDKVKARGSIIVDSFGDQSDLLVSYSGLVFSTETMTKNWSLIIVEDYGAVMDTIMDNVRYPVNMLAAFFVIAAFLMALLLRERLRTRLSPLLVSAKEIASGKTGVRTNLSGLDEFAELSRAFDDMARRTERHNIDLEMAIENARAANNAKTAFLSSISHEVRTPLANVIGFLELLQEERLGPEGRLYVRSALASSSTLLGLIEDILEFSRLERGQVAAIQEPFCLNILAQEVTESFLPQVKEKQVDLRVTSDNPEPIWITSDHRVIRQILINLLNNAVRFTATGNISVDLGAEDTSDGDELLIRLSVRDTGVGIDAQTTEKIREQLSSYQPVSNLDQQDQNLGLALCRHFGRLLNGNWEVASEPDKGTTFIFKMLALKADPISKLSFEEITAQIGYRLNILVVEDNDINQLLLKNILGKWGHSVILADTGEAAIKAVKETLIYPDQEQIDLILMDLALPGRSGIDVAQAITQLSERTANIPVIAVTAHVSGDIRQECLDAGMKGFVEKPVNSEELAAEIFRVSHIQSLMTT